MGRFRILPHRRAVLAEGRPMQTGERDCAVRLYGDPGYHSTIIAGRLTTVIGWSISIVIAATQEACP
jgi:hypothetical protein